jgi:predicted exporter
MRQNTFLNGLLLGLLAPVAAFLISKYVPLGGIFLEKPLAIYVIAGLINLIAMRFLYRSGREEIAKGILFSTFIGVLYLIFYQGFRIA